MQNAKYEESLNQYLEDIALTTTQADKIDSALQSIIPLMLETFPDAEMYAQGSYSTDTLVKPLTAAQGGGVAGEFDIDIVIERTTWEGAVEALDSVGTALKDSGIYNKMPIDTSKNSCVRVEYADDSGGVGFHVDLVPTHSVEATRYVPYREDDEWKQSDAKQFADWFNTRAEANPGIRQIALILKRLRDLNGQTNNIKSILILTLVEKHYFANGSIMGDLLSVLDGIALAMSDDKQAPFIANPVNTGENLSDGLTDYADVKDFIVTTKQELVTAIGSDDEKALKAIFGSVFDYESSAKAESLVRAAAAPVRPTRAFGIRHASSDK
jgi:hypothetical protein